MSNSIFEENIRDLHKGNIGDEEKHEEEAVTAEVIDDISDDDNASETGNLFEILSRMRELTDDEDDDDDYDNSGMDANDYHNKAVEYACRGKNKQATKICMDGLKHFPINVDLLADTIKYSSEAGDMDTACEHYKILKKSVPLQRWNWRAYTFSCDYLIGTDPVANEKECRMIIENYKKYIPYEEKACMAESELEMALGNYARSMSVLEEAICTHENASQCALRLADMQLDRGLYEKVIATTNYGIAASAEAQPSINIPYLYYIRALAKDYILHKRECNAEEIKQEEVNALSSEYEMLLNEFPELIRHAHNIKMRVKMLKFMKTA